jgi:hypothetical protein
VGKKQLLVAGDSRLVIHDPEMPGAGWEDSVSGNLWLTITPPPPMFFISVASKRVSDPVSSLFATLTGDFISVDSK